MNRLVALGVDGLDWSTVERLLPELPNLARCRANGYLRPLPSIFPPDSIPAWITIFTGEPPAEHGILESIDYLSANPAAAAEAGSAFLRERTFWDRASENGRRVCIVNPFMAYPAWPVNGTMVTGPVFVEEAEASVFPPDAFAHERLPQLGGIVDFPSDRTMGQFLTDSLRTTREQADFAYDALRSTGADVFFLNLLTIDRIQHFLWRYCDPDDPTYPGRSDLADGIDRAYRLVDEIVGRYAGELDDDDILVLLSDHGHGRRCTTMIHLDELLRREGLLDTGGFRDSVRTFLLEKAKCCALSVAYSLRQEHELYRFGRRVPGRKALKTSSYSIGSRSVAYTSRAFGRNSASGVHVSEQLGLDTRSAVIDHIRTVLLNLADPLTGELVCLWAKRREEVVAGRHADRFPDVLFQLREGVGIDFGVFGPRFSQDRMHRRISGGHRVNGVFAATTNSFEPPASVADVYDVLVRLATRVPTVAE